MCTASVATFHPTDTQYTFIFIFIGKADRQRGETERKILHPMIHSQVRATADAMPIRSQEPLLGLPHGRGVPKPWAVLHCFPRPQAGSWMGSRAAGIRTGTQMGSWACKARTQTTATPRQAHNTLLLYISEWNFLRN